MNVVASQLTNRQTTKLLLLLTMNPSLENRKPFATNPMARTHSTIKSVLIIFFSFIFLFRFARMNVYWNVLPRIRTTEINLCNLCEKLPLTWRPPHMSLCRETIVGGACCNTDGFSVHKIRVISKMSIFFSKLKSQIQRKAAHLCFFPNSST